MRWQTTLAVLGAGLALLAAGCGGSGAATTQDGTRQPGRGGPFTGANVTKLAGTLGVSETKLQAALKSVAPARGQRPPGGSQPPPQDGQRPGGGRRNIAAELAKKLGLPEAKVRTALQQVMPQRGGRPPGQPSTSTTPS